jgi:hypothetical protein
MSNEITYRYTRENIEHITPSLAIAVARKDSGDIYQVENGIRNKLVFDER